MITVLHEQRETALPDARADGEALWLRAGDLARATGWDWKPEGLCRDATCVPVPRARASELVHDDAELRARIGAAGRQRVIDRWTWRHTAVGTVEQYRALLAETAHIQARRAGGAASAPRFAPRQVVR